MFDNFIYFSAFLYTSIAAATPSPVAILTSFGPLDGKILRIGNMGYSSQKRNILILLGALEAVMLQNNVKIATGEGVAAAMEVYKNAEK